MAGMRIFDTFLFDNELSVLEHRLAETSDLVDVYVLVEAGETFRGEAKRLAFAESGDRFAAYASQIRHVRLPLLGSVQTDPWTREKNQRDAVRFALSDAAADDIILILDADEIPSRQLLKNLRSQGLDRARRLLMTRHYEAIDRLGPRSPCCRDPYVPFAFAHGRLRPESWEELAIDWFSRSGVAAPYRALLSDATDPQARGMSVHELRRTTPLAGALPHAGRHLCFVDPAAHPSQKLGRVAHEELAGQRATHIEHLARCRRYAIHHRGWWYAERPNGELPADLQRLEQRLATRHAAGRRFGAMRRLVRTWAWLRTWAGLPDGFVSNVDRHFNTLLPVLALPLLVLDWTRWVVSLRKARPHRRLRAPAERHV